MARIVGELADKAFLTSDNPRTEDPEKIIDDMELGLRGMNGEFFRVVDRAEAIRRAIVGASSCETVLIAGKGHEAYQILGDSVVPFDDVEVAREALHARSSRRGR
jgi:UDP-N-acetylmuramoyl-L-alanyl-D-glutamate--2,6-diaminopimelate ligase